MKLNTNLAATSPTNDENLTTPNLAVSALAWHETLTEREPFDKLFKLIPDRQVDRMSFIHALNSRNGFPDEIICPICRGYVEIDDETYGRIYCFCYMADWLRDLSVSLKGLRSKVRPGRTLETLVGKIPPEKLAGKRIQVTTQTIASVEKLHSFVKGYIETVLERPTMVISGNYGTGKSHAVEAIASHFGPRICVYHNGQDWNNLVQSALNDNRLNDFLSALRLIPVYIHNDWGRHHSTTLTDDNLMQVLSGRIDDGMPTILTTNTPLDQLGTLDPVVSSRLMGEKVRRLQLVSQDLRPIFE